MTDELRLDAYDHGSKLCVQCGERKPLTEFVRNPSSRDGYRRRCSTCEVTNRTEPKADRRERHKARDTRARHARRLGFSIDELEHFYGWELDRIEADILRTLEHGCPPADQGGCGRPVLGLPDIHIDIIDPTEPPFYGVNARPLCATCNRRKGSRSAQRLAIEEAERQAIARRGYRLVRQLSLFDEVPK